MWGPVKSLQSVIFLTGTSKWLSISGPRSSNPSIAALGFSIRNRTLRGSLRSCSHTAMNSDEGTLVQDMLSRIRSVNFMPEEIQANLLDFSVDGIKLGQVTASTADKLIQAAPQKPIFELGTNGGSEKYLTLSNAAGTTCDSRTAAVESVMLELRSQGIITGWRDEHVSDISWILSGTRLSHGDVLRFPSWVQWNTVFIINGLVLDESGQRTHVDGTTIANQVQVSQHA